MDDAGVAAARGDVMEVIMEKHSMVLYRKKF